MNSRISRKLIASSLLKVAKSVLAKDEDDYRYDPEHKHKPQGGGWQKTEKGWSKQKKEKGESSKPAPMTEEQKELARKAESRHWSVRRSVASNANCSSATLDKLAGDNAALVREAVARNPNASSAALDRLAGDENEVIRARAAKNRHCSPATLDRLAEDGTSKVRYAVADNPNCSPATLDRLAGDSAEYVRYAVADNPSSSTATLDRLAEDEIETVRYLAAQNLFAPSAIREKALKAGEMNDYYAANVRCTATARGEVASFKQSLGAQNHRGRNLQQLKNDFIRNMDPSKYESPEQFKIAKARIAELSPAEFGALMKSVAEDEEA